MEPPMPHPARTARTAWLAIPALAALAAAAWLAVSPSSRATVPLPARAVVPLSASTAVADPGPRSSSPPREPAAKGIVLSTSYGVPIPYAVFFAAGGVAFHQGSLTTSSHGCIHLTMAAARHYNEHLPVGAEVAVF
jgi:hypothetical protein